MAISGNSKIDLKSVIHLYLGQQIKVPGAVVQITNEFLSTWDFVHWGAKPVLRKLDGMTGKEVLTAFHMSYDDTRYQFDEFQKVDNNEFGWRARNQNGMECFMPANSFKPNVFAYLLSIGIDLFGLIESNQAIDKTTLSK